MKRITPSVERTLDGAETLLHPIIGDYYHSLKGAMSEALYVFIEQGFEYVAGCAGRDGVIRLLEVGFGSGLNAILTLERAEMIGMKVEYTTIDKYPICDEVVNELSFSKRHYFKQLHDAKWDEWCDISDGFRLRKLYSDLVSTNFDTTFDLVYFDAFAPDSQPELWSREVFGRIFDSMAQGGALVTYSAKGSVRRALSEVGFEVSRLKGGPGKHHMTRGVVPIVDRD